MNKLIRWTDLHKYKYGYRDSHNTDVLETIRREQRRLKAEAEKAEAEQAETQKKVTQIKGKA
jgi:hypothetical protein